MLFDGACKLVPFDIVMHTMTQQLGFPDSIAIARGLGVLILACTALYVYPRTAIVGAVLLTGVLGEQSHHNCVWEAQYSVTFCSAAISGYSCGWACTYGMHDYVI